MLSDAVGSVKDKIAVLSGVGGVFEKTNKSEFDEYKAETATKVELTTGLQSVASGSPKTDYATLALLQAGIPLGNTSTYLTTDGNWNRWDGSAWVVGGVYQSMGIGNDTVEVKSTKFYKTSDNLLDYETVATFEGVS